MYRGYHRPVIYTSQTLERLICRARTRYKSHFFFLALVINSYLRRGHRHRDAAVHSGGYRRGNEHMGRVREGKEGDQSEIYFRPKSGTQIARMYLTS